MTHSDKSNDDYLEKKEYSTMHEESKEIPHFITQDSVSAFDNSKQKALKLEKNI